MSRQDSEDIAAFARGRDLIVITDEIQAELTYDAPHTSIVSLPGMCERTIFLHLPSCWPRGTRATSAAPSGFAAGGRHLWQSLNAPPDAIELVGDLRRTPIVQGF